MDIFDNNNNNNKNNNNSVQNHPKCFKVDYNMNQIEVSYGGNKTDTCLFPVIIDNDVDQHGNVINFKEEGDDDDINEVDDEVNRNRYQRKDVVVSKNKEEEEKDEMFESLRRLSTAYDALLTSPSKTSKQVRFSLANRKMSVVPLLPNVSKDLTFLIDEIYFTNGKTSLELVHRTDKFQTKFFTRKKICTKKVRCVGTSLKNCVQSDVISIDIDQKSTLLPMMCKLMIIVEGAVIERGIPVLVRDFAVQVNLNSTQNNGILDEDSFNSRVSSNGDESDEGQEEEEEEEDTYESNFVNESKTTTSTTASSSHYCKLTRLSNIKKKCIKKHQQKNISGRRDSYYRRQSYFNLNEYTSIPYYQYIQQVNSTSKNNNNNNKVDAECMTEDYYLTADNSIMIINSSSSSKSSKDRTTTNIPIHHVEEREEELEINIPIKVERGIYKFNSNKHRTVYEEKYNRFESEVKHYNTSSSLASNRGFRFRSNNYPTIYTFYNHGEGNNKNNSENNNNEPILKIEDSRSVTQVFLHQLVDGNLKQ